MHKAYTEYILRARITSNHFMIKKSQENIFQEIVPIHLITQDMIWRKIICHYASSLNALGGYSILYQETCLFVWPLLHLIWFEYLIGLFKFIT